MLIFVFLIGSGLILFQNCSEVGFKKYQTETKASAGPGTVADANSDVNDDNSDTPSVPPPPPPSPSCHPSQVLIDNQCLCPGNSHWTGQSCITCQSHETFNSETKQCDLKCMGSGEYWSESKSQCVTCQSNQVWDGQQCRQITDQCHSYSQIVPPANGAPFVIPARDLAQTCYYIKIFDAVKNKPSNLNREVVPHLVTANHGSGGGTRHPLILGEKELTVHLQGPRDVVVNSKPDASHNTVVLIDNFLYGEFSTEEDIQFMGAGTADSQFNDYNGTYAGGHGIHVKNPRTNQWEKIQFQPFGALGTSHIGDINLSSFVPVNKNVKIDLKALDCGGSEEASDGYLIFK